MKKERHFHTNTCKQMFLETLLIIAKSGGNLNKCLLAGIMGWNVSPKKDMLKM